MIPTLFGIMVINFAVVQFAPGGPVEQIIAQLSGNVIGATARIGGATGAEVGSGGQVRPETEGAVGGAAAITSKYRGAQGLDPEFIEELEK